MHRPDDPYLDFLRSRRGSTFYRLPYPGNAGDALIQLGTERILESVGVTTTVDPRKADIILVPGGNPSMWPSIGVQRWRDIAARYPQAQLVVGPAGFKLGISDWPAFVNTATSPATGLFARDPDSFRALEQSVTRAGVKCALSHDPALSLRDSPWMVSHREAATMEYELVALRDDHEGASGSAWYTRVPLPGRLRWRLARRAALAARARKAAAAQKARFDASVPLLHNDVSRQLLEVFVEVIRAASAVHTDRLHVMITAAMLGKKVFAYRTSHAKLEGVYHHSLEGWADVVFVNETGPA